MQEVHHLPLIQAMTQIMEAERNLFGGRSALNASQIPVDIYLLLEFFRILVEDKTLLIVCKSAIPSAQRVLKVHRDMLREKLTKNSTKRKRKG
jgi:hypothetical protein